MVAVALILDLPLDGETQTPIGFENYSFVFWLSLKETRSLEMLW